MNSSEKHKGINKQKGIEQPKGTNSKAAKQFRSKRKNKIEAQNLFDELSNGNIVALSKAITVIESSNHNHHKVSSDLLRLSLPNSGNSIRIGITGVPGVGKSTFIEALGSHYAEQNKKIAILAVDPSSSSTKGSILGDKTRMETLVKKDNVFIRPTPSSTSLGGVARKTRETIILCEAAGFDTIIIETVGVGQSEIAVHSMVDFFLLLKLAGAGDELQGIKRGIIEMADLIAINKADGENLKAAKLAKQDFKNALHLYPSKSLGWQPKVLLCSAINNEGIKDITEEIESFVSLMKDNKHFNENRLNQQEYWLRTTIEEMLKNEFYNNIKVQMEYKNQLKLIRENKTTAYIAAEHLLNL